MRRGKPFVVVVIRHYEATHGWQKIDIIFVRPFVYLSVYLSPNWQSMFRISSNPTFLVHFITFLYFKKNALLSRIPQTSLLVIFHIRKNQKRFFYNLQSNFYECSGFPFLFMIFWYYNHYCYRFVVDISMRTFFFLSILSIQKKLLSDKIWIWFRLLLVRLIFCWNSNRRFIILLSPRFVIKMIK